MSPSMTKESCGKSVIFIGASYYNNWYLSKELKKLGWKTKTIVQSSDGADDYCHGWDHRIENQRGWDYFPLRPLVRLIALLLLPWRLRGYERPVRPYRGISRSLLRLLVAGILILAGLKRMYALWPLIKALWEFEVWHFSGARSIRYFSIFNPRVFGFEPIGWDIAILKRLGKVIVYSNNGCNDGVTPSSFRTWPPIRVCDSCRWRDEPDVCSDDRSHRWGKLRNAVADYQMTIGGNRKDYNEHPKVHEVPGFYCLDPNVWHPDLIIPANYILPLKSETVYFFHAVGNFDLRTDTSQRNIKGTRLYIDIIERLKKEGHNVDLLFFKDVPSRKIPYYQAQSDVFLEMPTFGFFGATGREGMMLGKPVVCYLRPEWMESMRSEIPDYVDELPVINATPETLYETLKDLVLHPEKRREIGRRSREFALKWHSSESGAQAIDRIYSRLLENPGSNPASMEPSKGSVHTPHAA